MYCRINIIFKVLIHILCHVLFYINSQELVDKVTQPVAHNHICSCDENPLAFSLVQRGKRGM